MNKKKQSYYNRPKGIPSEEFNAALSVPLISSYGSLPVNDHPEELSLSGKTGMAE